MKAGQTKEILNAIFKVVYGYDCHEHAALGDCRTDVYHSREYTKDLQIPVRIRKPEISSFESQHIV
jgi:hypothetical protein